MKKWKLLLSTLFFATIIFSGVIGIYATQQDREQEPINTPFPETATIQDDAAQQAPPQTPTAEKPIPPKKMPSFIDHDIAFTSQAPRGNWNQPYQDACEEASLIIVHVAITTLDPSSSELKRSEVALDAKWVDKEILRLVDFQNKTLGDFHSTTAEQTAQIARDFYGYKNIRVEKNPTTDLIKRALANDELIITPMAGQLLDNPYFTAPGPEYHMLVIKGYDDDTEEFITHDVGTRRGENYRYSYNTIMNALHDWTGSKATIEQGEKQIIIINLQQS